MGSLVKKQTEKFLRDKKRRKRWMAMFLCLALLVTSGTFAALRMDGRAMDDDGNAESGTEVYDESLYAGEPVQDGAQGEQGETGGSLDGEDAGQPEMGDADAGNADIGASADGEDAGQPEINDPDAGNMDVGPQEPEDPDTGDTEIGEQLPEDPGTETADPNEDIEGGQPDEGNSPEEEAQQPDGQIRETVIKTAESQIGNTYDRYAALDEEGICQEDWSALFVSYCLSQAGVEGIPLETDSRQWMEKLEAEESRLYRDDTYSPKPGDIVFYRLNTEDREETADINTADTDPIRAGLVKGWNAEAGEIQVIAGDVETDGTEQDRVNAAAYNVSGEDAQITIEGYGQLPEADTQEPGTEGENAGAEIESETGSGAENGTDMPDDSETNGDTVSDPDESEDPQDETDDTASGNAVSDNTISENTTSANMVSKNAVLKKTASKETLSGNAISWGTLTYKDVTRTDNEGITTWDVSETAHRYLELPVRMNISTAVGTEITFPYKLDLGDAGRKVENIETADGDVTYTYKPVFKDKGIVEDDWDKQINEEKNTVTITSKGQHATLDVFYEFDCWNIVSDEGFTIEVKVRVPEEEDKICTLKGKIQTGHNVEIGEYLNGNDNSDYAFDGFGGADKKTAYIPKWSQVYEDYFGLKKEDFNEDYIYDIAPFVICPKHQQPYNISGSFKPQGNGELIGGIYMMDSRKDPNGLCIKLGQNDFAGSAETGYNFAINNDKLIFENRYAVVSNLSDTTNNKVYTLYFLVKYPRISDNDKDIGLKADLTLSHTGVENRETKTVSAETTLYEGKQKYRDRIYWASYNPETGENRTGLSSLSDGKNATIDFSADFYCLNENRSDFQYGTEEKDLKKYRMEAVIDLSFLPNVTDTPMLGEGDYQFSSYKLSLIDAAGAWSHNNHGVPNVGWSADKYRKQGSVPDWAKDEVIEIYGSKSLTNQDPGAWEKVGTIKASEVWAYDQDRAFEGNYKEISGDGYVRLKVVYNSRLTTALRVGYQMQVKPSVLNKVPNDGKDLETLKLRSWFNYLAYDGNQADAKDFGRYPVSDEDDGFTIEKARQHDAAHPYPGYNEPLKGDGGYWAEEYSLRNRATITLGRSTDAAGMLVTQALYDSSGKVIGDKISGTWEQPHALHPTDSYCKQENVTNVSEIVYSITGVVTNGANDINAFNMYRNEPSAALPYKAMKQRYYVLLPEGLTLNMNPDEDHNQREGTEEYLSPIAPFYKEYTEKQVSNAQEDQPVSKGNIPNWNATRENGKFLTQMMWEFNVPENGNYGSVRRNPESGGQLFIFDRTLTEAGENRSDVWGLGTQCWGQGFSFSVVPKRGTGTLIEGDYMPQFWCQFLDENDQPIPMNDFLQEEDNNAQELNGVYGSDLDKDTLLYIPISFHNRSTAGSSQAKIGLDGDITVGDDGRNQVDLEGNYEYQLTYSIGNGKSRNAVLWCNIEGYNRGGESSEWKGTLQGVDLNGNTDTRVYVLTEGFNVNTYLSGAQSEWLADDKYGWKEVPANELDSYDWSSVKSIAFDFGEREFNSQEEGKQSASVAIKMQAPEKSEVTTKPYHNRYTAYNEFVFSDKHGENDDLQPGQGLSDYTQLDIYIPTEIYELPSTGGTGIYWYTIGGMLLMMSASLILYKNKTSRRKRERRSAC